MAKLIEATRAPEVLLKLRDEGIVALDASTRSVLAEVERSVLAPVDRWAIFIFSHFIVVAFEW
jgi:hypothetical protein